MSLKGSTAVVTGASRGIGRAIARSLGQAGARLAICARGGGALEETAADFQDQGLDTLALTCDVSQRHQVDFFFDQVESRWGPAKILVNNAGVGGPTPISEDKDESWRLILDVNLDGPYFCTRRALKTMPDGGRIINLSSVLGKFGVPGYAAYCTAKHGVIGLTKALSLELAPRRITVNAICPGWVDTEMARQGMEAGAAATGVSYEEIRSKALDAVPLKEMLQPNEIAAMVCFLASEGARNITGQAYNVCGGQVMH